MISAKRHCWALVGWYLMINNEALDLTAKP
jgi:hypothetical protein